MTKIGWEGKDEEKHSLTPPCLAASRSVFLRVVVRGGYPPNVILAALDDEAAVADAAVREEVLVH